jgi:hypothetical protein
MQLPRQAGAPEARFKADNQDPSCKLVPALLIVACLCRVMLQACFARVPARQCIHCCMRPLWHASALCRLSAALDAFLLKIVVEERLGYPVQLLSDGQLADIGPGLKISEGTSAGSAYSALARGEVDMHPEVTPVNAMPYGHGNLCNTTRKSALDPMHRCGRPTRPRSTTCTSVVKEA